MFDRNYCIKTENIFYISLDVGLRIFPIWHTPRSNLYIQMCADWTSFMEYTVRMDAVCIDVPLEQYFD